ncbi:MAG: hypothetical protein K2X74_05680 [Acetobacteraceae bacterium]|nr:hypothetical protein [Acetobacteraceae bacterium]
MPFDAIASTDDPRISTVTSAGLTVQLDRVRASAIALRVEAGRYQTQLQELSGSEFVRLMHSMRIVARH